LLIGLLVCAGLVYAQEPPYANFMTLTVTERGGMARTNWPVTVGVPIRYGEVTDPASFLYLVREDGDRFEPTPFQLFAIVTPTAGAELQEAFEQATYPTDRPLLRLFEIGFPANVDAYGAATYRLYYGEPTAPAPPVAPQRPLVYTGENPGIDIGIGEVIFHLNPQTGSLLYFTAGEKDYEFKQSERRDVHYNPDVFVPHLSWGHTSDWNFDEPGPYTPSITIAQGPYAYRSFRKGMIPRANETLATFTYTFFAGLPIFYTSSSMEFTLDTLVYAVRNSEYVFSRGLMTKGFYADADGRPQEVPLFNPDAPEIIFGKVAALSPDVPYLGMLDEVSGVGMCVVNLARYTSSYSMADNAANPAAEYYIADPGMHQSTNPDYDFAYLVRPEIYQMTVVPKGSLFAERNAVIIFRAGQGEQRYDDMLRWVHLIRTPPAISVTPVIRTPQ